MGAGDVEFRILGPLEAIVAGQPVQLGGPRAQATLAALLLARGQVVPAERIVDLVWGEEPPASVRGQVAIAISKLRKVLPDVIETVGGGYRLLAVHLDAARAEELIAAARSAAAPAEAAAGFRTALGLWRGPVLAGLGEVAVAADAWEHLRLAVHEDWVELELLLGRHGEVTGPLTAFVAEHPLRERSRAQLMLALHRCGRRADALEVYRIGRDVLVRELGIEPGAELRAMERAILTDDLEPEQPPSASWFTGRTDELKILSELLSSQVDGAIPIAAVTGPGGTGKSALAIHAAHELAAAFPDGQLHIDLHGCTPVEALGRFLRSLGMSASDVPDDVEEAGNRYRSLTSGRRLLVVLDNAVDAAQVRPLLPSGSGCAVIVTSRQVLATLDGATHVYLT